MDSNVIMADSVVWGWESFFAHLQRFLEEIERRFSSSNEQFAFYVIERLDVCISNLLNVRELLTSHLEANLSTGEADIITEYEGDVGILLSGMEEIARQWSEHADHIGLQTTATRYMAPFQRSI